MGQSVEGTADMDDGEWLTASLTGPVTSKDAHENWHTGGKVKQPYKALSLSRLTCVHSPFDLPFLYVALVIVIGHQYYWQ